MKRIPFLLLLFCTFISSCGTMSEKELEEKISSGVVLIQNRCYYEVALTDDYSVYFAGFDEEGNMTGLALDPDSVQVETSYGTGFFISPKGEIATNAHVVANALEDEDVNTFVEEKVITGLKNAFDEIRIEYDEQLEEYRQSFSTFCKDTDNSVVEVFEYKKIYDELREYIQINKVACEQASEMLDEIDTGESEIIYHNEVSVAYNNTLVTHESDFAPCVVRKTDSEHDLAIIQLKDKKTPAGKHVFTVEARDPLETYNWKDKLEKTFKDDKNSTIYMVGFNYGPELAITKEGVKAQFNKGNVSQTTSDELMYSIPTLPGSSGSPVVNRHGELVAINFAKIANTQGFNYGVRVKHLKKLIREK